MRPSGAPAGVLADLAVERARLRRDVTRRSPSTAAPCNGCYDAGTTHSHWAFEGTSVP